MEQDNLIFYIRKYILLGNILYKKISIDLHMKLEQRNDPHKWSAILTIAKKNSNKKQASTRFKPKKPSNRMPPTELC